MTILLTGGGTGGHIIPLLAVAHELRALQPDAKLVYVGERGGHFKHLTIGHSNLDETHYIFAGKFRRYHGESWLIRLFDVKTNVLNVRDGLRTLIGFFQALWLLLKLRPQVMFVKGGFVAVPLGLAAALLRIPYITHDSDTLPGLANRIIGRWAQVHATGMPVNFYSYPKAKTYFTGTPVAERFTRVDQQAQTVAKTVLGLPADASVILITGGSLGSQRINTIAKSIVPQLLEKHLDCFVIHHVGQKNKTIYQNYKHPRLRIEPFIERFYEASAAADIVVARGGASTIAELAIQAKPFIVIPSPFLTGGHQLKNAKHLAQQGATIVLDEAELLAHPEKLLTTLERLLDNPIERRQLSKAISVLGKPQAAKELARLILKVAVG